MTNINNYHVIRYKLKTHIFNTTPQQGEQAMNKDTGPGKKWPRHKPFFVSVHKPDNNSGSTAIHPQLKEAPGDMPGASETDEEIKY